MKNLTQAKQGQEVKIKSIQGGAGIKSRLEAMGIRAGTKIKKISSQFMKGPVIIQVGNTQLAIGHGMAFKINIE